MWVTASTCLLILAGGEKPALPDRGKEHQPQSSGAGEPAADRAASRGDRRGRLRVAAV
jgi:hypothetical protein